MTSELRAQFADDYDWQELASLAEWITAAARVQHDDSFVTAAGIWPSECAVVAPEGEVLLASFQQSDRGRFYRLAPRKSGVALPPGISTMSAHRAPAVPLTTGVASALTS
jgi:hypothetical protein